MIQGFHHIAISSPDLDRLAAFYRDVIGFEPVFEMNWEAGNEAIDQLMALKDVAGRVVMLRTGNSFLEIFEFSSPQPRAQIGDRPVIDHGFTHICLAVDDARAEYERLSAAGVRFHCSPGDSAMPLVGAYGRDPDGNVIELLQVNDPDFALHFANRKRVQAR